MGDGYPGQERCLRDRQHLEPVAHDHDCVWREGIECVGKSEDAESDRFGHSKRRVAGKLHLDLAVDRKPVGLDRPIRESEFGNEMRPRRDELQRELGIVCDGADERLQDAVLRAAAGDDADSTQAGHAIPALLGRLMMRPARDSATGSGALGALVYIGNRLSSVHAGRVM